MTEEEKLFDLRKLKHITNAQRKNLQDWKEDIDMLHYRLNNIICHADMLQVGYFPYLSKQDKINLNSVRFAIKSKRSMMQKILNSQVRQLRKYVKVLEKKK